MIENPELLSPVEYKRQRMKETQDIAQEALDNPMSGMASRRALATIDAKQYPEEEHARMIRIALSQGNPVSSEAAMEYKIPVPKGYIRDGGQFRKK